uniref:Radical SAM protein n=2 Tax=Geoglobus ahangari TaxID=113653 RepID=A0A7C4WEU5_9EURY
MKASSHCEFCPGNDEKGDPVHHPSYEITTRCNLQCIYCYSIIAVKKGKAPKPGYYGKTENVKAITISQFGEPLLAGIDEVERVAKGLKEMFPDARLDLQTNGIFLDKKAIKRLEKYFDIAMVSLNAASRKKYIEITGFDGFDTLIENLKALKLSSVKGIIRTIHMPGINDEDVFKIAELSNSLEMEMFLQPLSVYNVELMEKHGLDMERTERLIEFLKVSEKLEEITDLRIPGCIVVNLKKVIKEYGRDCLEFIRRKAIANVPEIRREWKFKI